MQYLNFENKQNLKPSQRINGLQNDQKEISQQPMVQIPDLDQQYSDGRVDFMQEGRGKGSTLRILDEFNIQLSPKYSDQHNLNKEIGMKENAILQNKNIQSFSSAITNLKNTSYKLIDRQQEKKNQFIRNKMNSLHNGSDITPYTKHLEKENQNDNRNDRQAFEELDEWKCEVDNIKRIQHFTQQILSSELEKQQKSSNEPLQRQLKTQNQQQTSQDTQRQRIYQDDTNEAVEIVQQMIEISNQQKQEEQKAMPYNENSMNKQGRNKTLLTTAQDRIMNVEPKLNEFIINSIMNHEDMAQSQNFKIGKSSLESSPEGNKPKHFISYGASPKLRRDLKIKQMKQDSILKQSSPNLKNVTFKEDQNRQSYQNKTAIITKEGRHYTSIDLSKKTVKQIQSEANEKLIEKLFLMKLKKKIEPFHNEQNNHLKHRLFNRDYSQNIENVTSKEVVSNSLIQNNLLSNRNYQVTQQQTNTNTHSRFATITTTTAAATSKGFKLSFPISEPFRSSNQSRNVSPQQNKDKLKVGFQSHRDDITEPQNKANMNLIIKQQNIVKDEIENFQKKTLESFKFIQEMKRSRMGTPQLVNLVSGRKVGEMDNQIKTEQYLKQLDKEFSLNSVKKSAQFTQEFIEASKQNQLNQQFQDKLLDQYNLHLSKIRDKKEYLQHHRLESFRLQQIINQHNEEKIINNKKMQEELDNIFKQSYVMNVMQEKSDNKNGLNQTKAQQRQISQRTVSHFHTQIVEKQENIKQDFNNKQRSLSNKIKNLKQCITDHTTSSNQIQEELRTLKNVKIQAKKQLKDHYLSLLQINKAIDSPQISIIQLIQLMQGIGEKVNEKMFPPYFDEHNIAFIKKLQELSQEKESLQKEISIAQKSAKNIIHSKMYSLEMKSQGNNQFLQSQMELASSPDFQGQSVNVLNQTDQRKQQQNSTDAKSRQPLSQNNSSQQNIFASQNGVGFQSSSIISQNQLSNRNCDEDDRKLLQMMIGNTVNHKKEIKKTLQKISKNTIETKSESNKKYLPFQLSNQEELNQEDIIDINDQESLQFQSKQNGNINQESLKSSADKNDEEYYFLLNNLKKGSLSVLDFHKKIIEKIEEIENEIQNLKEMEMERLIKQYNNNNSEDQISNLKKIFILMYGYQEGNQWNQKFIKKRREIQLKSQGNKTFNFQDVLFSSKKGQIIQQNQNGAQDDISQLKMSKQKQNENNSNVSKLQKVESQKVIEQKINNERAKVQMHFRHLQQDDATDSTRNTWISNQIFFKDPLSFLSNQKADRKQNMFDGIQNVQDQQNRILTPNHVINNQLFRGNKVIHFANSNPNSLKEKEEQNLVSNLQNYKKYSNGNISSFQRFQSISNIASERNICN